MAVMTLVVLCWGLGPPISKLVTAPAVVAAFYRFWLSVPLFYAAAALTGHRLRWVTLRRTALAGAAFGINLVFVFLSVGADSVAVLSVMTALQPVFILLVAIPLLGERPTLAQIGWTAIGIGGAAIMILGPGDGVSASLLGVAYAGASVVTFTVYFLLTKRARSQLSDVNPMEWMAGICLFAALAVTPWALTTSSIDDFRAVDGTDWLWLGFIIVITGMAGHVAMAWTHRYVPANRSSVFLLSMNVVSVGAAWPIHNEPIGLVQLVGGVVLLVAVVAIIRDRDRPAPAPTEMAPAGKTIPTTVPATGSPGAGR